MQRAYLVYGFLILVLLGYAEYRGWSFLRTASANEGPVPASIRDNPGAYRDQFIRNPRYVGGK
jgi:hypothetical protein